MNDYQFRKISNMVFSIIMTHDTKVFLTIENVLYMKCSSSTISSKNQLVPAKFVQFLPNQIWFQFAFDFYSLFLITLDPLLC